MTSTTDVDTAAPEAWSQGWWSLARHCPSPNWGLRPDGAVVDLIVLHSISLPPGEYGGPEVEHLFTNRLDWEAHPYFQTIRGIEVSAHFFIRRDGAVVQFVPIDRRAWHAGQSQWAGRSNCNDFSIGIELEGLEGDTFEAAQYRSLCHLCQSLAKVLPIAHVAGHEHIAPDRKIDPGPGFDWRALQERLSWSSTCFPESIGRGLHPPITG